MRVCNFRLPASSAPLSGGLLEGFLESMLEKSTLGAVARHGTLCSKRGPGRDQARKTITAIGMRSACFLVSVIVLFSSTLAVAQDYRGTAEQRASCMPDAFRLCASYIPDATRVEMCLRQQKPALSDACRSVFEQNDGSAPGGARNESWSTN
jgi:hypothetical protein